MTKAGIIQSALRAGVSSLFLAFFSASAANALDGTTLQSGNMHVGPAADFPVVAIVPADAKVRVNGCMHKEGWCAIRHKGQHGWIASASLDVTGITRSTNKLKDSVIVINLTDQVRSPFNQRARGRSAVPGYITPDGMPILQYDLGPAIGHNGHLQGGNGVMRYNTSSSDRFSSGTRYYDRRFGQHYGPVLRGKRRPFGLIDGHDRRYRSFVGQVDKNGFLLPFVDVE